MNKKGLDRAQSLALPLVRPLQMLFSPKVRPGLYTDLTEAIHTGPE